MASRDATPRDGGNNRVREITLEALVQASKLAVGKTEQLEHYLKRITHLTLPGSDKKVIKNIQLLERCPNLKVLYMYDNEIEVIEHLDGVPQLIHLHLQNNWITKLENLDGLPHLEKLYIEGNRISRLQGLDKCLYLQELHMSNQKLSKHAIFTFEESTLRALSRSLRVLNLANSRIHSTRALAALRGLQQLDLSLNDIADLDDVLGLLSSLTALSELDLSGNPVTTTPRYREKAMTFSSSRLTLLDKKDIDANQRRMMQTHLAHKHQKRQEADSSSNQSPAAAAATNTQSAETIRMLKHGSSVHQLRKAHVSGSSKALNPQWEPHSLGVAGSSCSAGTALVRSNASAGSSSNNSGHH